MIDGSWQIDPTASSPLSGSAPRHFLTIRWCESPVGWNPSCSQQQHAYHNTLYAILSLSLSSTIAFWHHLPNKLLSLTNLSPDLLPGKLKWRHLLNNQSSVTLEERHFQICKVSRNLFKEVTGECALPRWGHTSIKEEGLWYRKQCSMQEGGEGSPEGADVYSWVIAGCLTHRATRSAWNRAEGSGRELL